MKITLRERRFLIIWIILHCTALFVNVTKTEGNLRNKIASPIVNIFTTNYCTSEGFWPFVAFMEYGACINVPPVEPNSEGIYDPSSLVWADHLAVKSWNFFGIFYSYNTKTFLVYIILGIGAIFLPKLWREKSVN